MMKIACSAVLSVQLRATFPMLAWFQSGHAEESHVLVAEKQMHPQLKICNAENPWFVVDSLSAGICFYLCGLLRPLRVGTTRNT